MVMIGSDEEKYLLLGWRNVTRTRAERAKDWLLDKAGALPAWCFLTVAASVLVTEILALAVWILQLLLWLLAR
jgi:hypothetical protein